MKIAVHHLFRLIDVLKISVEIACWNKQNKWKKLLKWMK
jgi:hypothetical protein